MSAIRTYTDVDRCRSGWRGRDSTGYPERPTAPAFSPFAPRCIEHRLFSFITQNWRGKPLVSLRTIVQLIAATTTETGLKVRCEVDPKTYPAGVKITDRQIDEINILRHSFYGEWKLHDQAKGCHSTR